ncbi:conserved hypothetical protein [Solidesulfovibrio fructosivorans JJ]]|uniref:Uncharacterized protein n=1 Tax=Solidesulfovibrio fructosivorans JJ] TaxID=596151 RepID=E1K2M0_SOLFR|nr:hypothetical protein [Solidesulfovibrio fructosivorans]EFL49136.1 conserved hypothetical protein [Solidesulfovibrio fructosivorans JJ]]
MKRCILALACFLMLAHATAAWADTPNIRQSINYFMNYFNEAVVQAIHLKEYEQREKLTRKRPYTQEYVFIQDMNARIEKTLGLALNLCDIYYIYNKTTYCFTKDEKNYLFDRIDNIMDTLQKITETPFNIDQGMVDDKKSFVGKNVVEFNKRIQDLRAFIKTSLVVFQR